MGWHQTSSIFLVNAEPDFLRDIHEYYDCSKKKVEEYPAKNKIGRCYFINDFLQRKWELTSYFCCAGKA